MVPNYFPMNWDLARHVKIYIYIFFFFFSFSTNKGYLAARCVVFWVPRALVRFRVSWWNSWTLWGGLISLHLNIWVLTSFTSNIVLKSIHLYEHGQEHQKMISIRRIDWKKYSYIFCVYMWVFLFNHDLSVLVCLISLFICPYIFLWSFL